MSHLDADYGVDSLGGKGTILSCRHYTGNVHPAEQTSFGSTSQALTLWSLSPVELMDSAVISFWPLCLGFPCVESRTQGMLWAVFHPDTALPCSWVFTYSPAKDPGPHNTVRAWSDPAPHCHIWAWLIDYRQRVLKQLRNIPVAKYESGLHLHFLKLEIFILYIDIVPLNEPSFLYTMKSEKVEAMRVENQSGSGWSYMVQCFKGNSKSNVYVGSLPRPGHWEVFSKLRSWRDTSCCSAMDQYKGWCCWAVNFGEDFPLTDMNECLLQGTYLEVS